MPKKDRLFVVLQLKVLHHGISCLLIIEIIQHLHLTELMGADKPRNVIHYRFTTLKRAGQYEKDHEVPVLWIDPLLHRTLRRSEAICQTFRIVRSNNLIFGPMQQQGWRCAGVYKIYGLRLNTIVGTEDLDQFRIIAWQKVIRTRKSYEATQITARQPHLSQVARVQGKHSRNIGASRMSHEKQAGRVAAEVVDVVPGPGNGGRSVLDEGWEFPSGVDPVIRDHGDETTRRQCFAYKAVILAAPTLERTAIKEHHYWQVSSFALRTIDVQFLTLQTAIVDPDLLSITQARNQEVDLR